MRTMTREAALRAAARVAFGATFSLGILGCGGALESQTSPPAKAIGAEADEANADRTSSLACRGPVAIEPLAGPTAISQAELACCNAYTEQQMSDGSFAEAGGRDPSFVNCCKALIAGADQHLQATIAGTVRAECCFGNVVAEPTMLYAHILCTPWGPSVPPGMDYAFPEIA